jgi:hypothetical protein
MSLNVNDARSLASNPSAVLPQETRTRDLDSQIRIIEKNNRYYVKPKGGEDGEERLPEQISNFTMEVVRTERFADDAEAGVRRTIRLTADTGFSIPTTADPEQICNKAAFKKFLLSKGNFHFWGNDSTVELLMAKIFRPDGAEVLAKQISGYEPETDLAKWADGHEHLHGQQSLLQHPRVA